MTNALVRFSLYEIPLCADIAAAYHNILVDGQTALLRLFYWFSDPRGKLERGRVFKQATQAFGDTSAAFGLECAILKHVVTAASMLVTKYILEFVRYSDNILYSFQTQEEFHQVRKDMGWVCMLDLTRAKERDKGTPEEQDLGEVDIRKEGIAS